MKKYRRLCLFVLLNSLLLISACTGTQATTGVTTGGVPNTGDKTPVVKPGTVLNVPGNITIPAQPQQIVFPNNASSYLVNLTLQPNTPVAYQIHAAAGQHMVLILNGDAKYQVYDPGAHPLSGVLSVPGPLNVLLDQAGVYTIALQGQGNAAMSVYIPPNGADPAVAAPVPANLQALPPQSGGALANLSLNMDPAQPQGFTFTGISDQTVIISTVGNATAALLTPDQLAVMPDTSTYGRAEYPLPEGGKYTLVVFGSGPVKLNLSVPPGANAPATAIPLPAASTRVTIPSGETTTTQQVVLDPAVPQAFVLTLQQSQELDVLVSGKPGVSVYGPGGTVLTVDHPTYTQSWSATAYQAGDYTVVVQGSGPTTVTFFTPAP